jgi:hypothetical protein
MRPLFKIAGGIVGLFFLIGLIGAMFGGGGDSASVVDRPAAPVADRCVDVSQELADGIATGLKPRVRLVALQAVKSKESHSSFGDVYYVSARLKGPKVRTYGTWIVFGSLGQYHGLIWVANPLTAKFSDFGVDVPVKRRIPPEVPEDGAWESADCVYVAGWSRPN